MRCRWRFALSLAVLVTNVVIPSLGQEDTTSLDAPTSSEDSTTPETDVPETPAPTDEAEPETPAPVTEVEETDPPETPETPSPVEEEEEPETPSPVVSCGSPTIDMQQQGLVRSNSSQYGGTPAG